MQQHLQRQDGVAKVDVSLVDRKAVVYPKTDFRFDPAALFKAVYDSGVTVSEMSIVASGQLLDDPARGLVLKVSSAEVFDVKPNEVSEKLKNQIGPGNTVRLRGLLYKKSPGKPKRKPPVAMSLEILEVLK